MPLYIYIFIWFHFTFHNYFFCKKCYRSRVVESMYAHVSYFPHLRNWNVQFWVLLSLSTMISKINTWTRECVSTFSLVIVHFNSLGRYEQLASITRIFIKNWGAACHSSSWFYPVADLSSGGWTRVAADSILQLSRVLVAGHKLRPSQVLAAGYNLRLTRVLAAEYKLQLILSCG